MKARLVLIAGIILVIIAGSIALVAYRNETTPVPEEPVVVVEEEETPAPPFSSNRVIGASVEGRDIELYSFGNGSRTVLFAGGMHGGYEWNSVLLAYNFIDYVEAHPEFVPADMTILVIPSLNPDGTYAVVGKEGRFARADVPAETGPVGTGRFNANKVDLNRNFDCKWQPTSSWRGNTVSAGTAPFSEPEAAALRDLVAEVSPEAVVFWHSQSNAVYASECQNGILSGTRSAMKAYATAAGYPAVDTFDAYPITGDAEGWLASIGIPAITVELSTHETVEWEKNLRGVTALIANLEEASLAR